MSSRKNSFDNKDRCNSRDSRTWSIGSFGSIESIKMDEEEKGKETGKEKEKEKEKKPIRRRIREMNIDDRRKSPNPTYWGLIDLLKKTQNNHE